MRHFEKNKRTIQTGNHSDEISAELFQTKPTELYYLYYLKYISKRISFYVVKIACAILSLLED